MLLSFLACPKCEPSLLLSFTPHISTLSIDDNTYRDDPTFHKFWCQLMHSSLAKMLESLKQGMSTPEVIHCPDNHVHQAVYGLGPYIGDYPKQMALACVIQNWCPK